MAGIADADKVALFASSVGTDIKALRALPPGGGGGTGGGNVTRVLYTGSAWPARPTTTAYVEWVDPSGTAAIPSAAAVGDTMVLGSGAAGVTPVELLSAGDVELTTTNWWLQTGTPVFDRTAGTITLDATLDRAARSLVPVIPGAMVKLTVTPAVGSSGLYWANVAFSNAGGTYISSSCVVGPTGGVGVGVGAVPTGAANALIALEGRDGNVAVIDRVSLRQTV